MKRLEYALWIVAALAVNGGVYLWTRDIELAGLGMSVTLAAFLARMFLFTGPPRPVEDDSIASIGTKKLGP